MCGNGLWCRVSVSVFFNHKIKSLRYQRYSLSERSRFSFPFWNTNKSRNITLGRVCENAIWLKTETFHSERIWAYVSVSNIHKVRKSEYMDRLSLSRFPVSVSSYFGKNNSDKRVSYSRFLLLSQNIKSALNRLWTDANWVSHLRYSKIFFMRFVIAGGKRRTFENATSTKKNLLHKRELRNAFHFSRNKSNKVLNFCRFLKWWSKIF